jgi:molybdate transport system regulatory protein
VTVCTKRWLEVDGKFAIGEHGFELLAAVERAGSLAEAARMLGWSYRHAWGYVRGAERTLGGPLLLPRPGKGAARGARLSELGRTILRTGSRLTIRRRTLELRRSAKACARRRSASGDVAVNNP